jgi:hypothetical protein
MDGREIEARMLMWAVAEISWEDASGQHCQASAVLEDRSNSGACVRLTRPVAVAPSSPSDGNASNSRRWRGIAAGMAGSSLSASAAKPRAGAHPGTQRLGNLPRSLLRRYRNYRRRRTIIPCYWRCTRNGSAGATNRRSRRRRLSALRLPHLRRKCPFRITSR